MSLFDPLTPNMPLLFCNYSDQLFFSGTVLPCYKNIPVPETFLSVFIKRSYIIIGCDEN